MIGAVAGDIIGSVYEHDRIKTKDFALFSPRSSFTDDSVLTIAIAKATLEDHDYKRAVWEMGRKYPQAGYGGSFIQWLRSGDPKPYGSWGNGAAMRVSPIGFAFDDADTVLLEATRTALISHDHPEGIKGAQATALAVFLARTTRNKTRVKEEVAGRFGYDLNPTIEEIRPTYGFDESCQGTVPQALTCFLESTSFEDAVRNAVSLGGDSDTLACIAGGIAEAHFQEIPLSVLREVRSRLTRELWDVSLRFYKAHGISGIAGQMDALG